MTKLLLFNATIVTLDPSNPLVEDGAVLLDGPLIAAVGDYRDLRKAHPDARSLSMQGGYLLPGLINAHTHCYSSFALGMPPSGDCADFHQVLQKKWWHLDNCLTEEDCYYSALLAMLDSLKHGTTAMIDHHSSPQSVVGILDIMEKAAATTGIRGSFCYEVSDRNGAENASLGIEENRRFLAKVASNQPERIRAHFGLHASFTLSDTTLDRCAKAGHEAGAGFHVHLNEAALDDSASLDQFGKTAIKRFSERNMFNRLSLAGHAVHVDPSDLELLTLNDTAVAHNPQSNMNNAVGACPLERLAEAGVCLCLGTDAMTNDMLEEARIVPLVRSHETKQPGFGAQFIHSMLFENNARVLSRIFGQKIGRIAPGYIADIVLRRYTPVTPITSDNILGHIVWGMSRSPVEMVLVDGRIIIEHGKLLRIDEERVYARSRELAQEVWKRFREPPR